MLGGEAAPCLCDEPGLRLEIPAADKLLGKIEYVTSLPVPKSCQISFRTFTWNEAVRSSGTGPDTSIRHPVFLPVHIPSLPEKRR